MSLINDALRKAGKEQKKRAPQGPLGVPLQPAESLKRPSNRPAQVVGAIFGVTLLGVAVWAFGIWWKTRNPPAQPPIQVASLAPSAESSEEVPSDAVTANAGGSAPSSSSAEPTENTARSSAPAVAQKANAQPKLASVTPKAVEAESEITEAASNQQPMPEPITVPMRTSRSSASPAPAAPPAFEPIKPTRPAPPVRTSAGNTESRATAAIPYSVPTPAPKSGGTTQSPNVDPSRKSIDLVNMNRDAAATAGSETSFPNLTLQGIFFRKTNPSAMINRRALYIGDEIGGVKVVDIQRRSVTLEKDGQRKTLSMGGY